LQLITAEAVMYGHFVKSVSPVPQAGGLDVTNVQAVSAAVVIATTSLYCWTTAALVDVQSKDTEPVNKPSALDDLKAKSNRKKTSVNRAINHPRYLWGV
jgi:hypothetical protein